MTDHIFQTFPQHIEIIRLLLQQNPTFWELFSDYEEISTWVSGHSHLAGQSSTEYDQALELMRDLEDDIKKIIKENQ
jgi:hypothetical protein